MTPRAYRESLAEVERLAAANLTFSVNTAANLPADPDCARVVAFVEEIKADDLSRDDAYRLAGEICGILPAAQAGTMDRAMQIRAIAEALSRYPTSVARDCTGLDGLLGTETFRPSPARIIEWCDQRMQSLEIARSQAQAAIEHRAEIRRRRQAEIDGQAAREAAELEAKRVGMETPDERRARIVREKIADLRRAAPADDRPRPSRPAGPLAARHALEDVAAALGNAVDWDAIPNAKTPQPFGGAI